MDDASELAADRKFRQGLNKERAPHRCAAPRISSSGNNGNNLSKSLKIIGSDTDRSRLPISEIPS